MHWTNKVAGFGLGSWWRFAEYEIAGGYIRPAPGAAIEEYDPWELYSLAQESRDRTQPPYQSLLELDRRERLSELNHSAPERTKLTLEQRAEIIRWCESYGLLGLLLHRVNKVVLSARQFTVSEDDIPEFSAFEQRTSIWVGGNWLEDIPDYWTGSAPVPVAQVQDGQDWKEEPIGRAWGRYFPSLSEDHRTTYVYPKPMTEEFWRIYAEPVEDFLKYVGQLVTALRRVESAPSFQSKGRQHGLGLESLNSLASRVSPALELTDDGRLRQVWGSPSLLASLATMAIFDIGGSQRILRCETCERHFVTPAYQAKYCSDTCRNTAQKRRSRAKEKRVAQASKSKGDSNG